jgi:signal transduction histidine kinase
MIILEKKDINQLRYDFLMTAFDQFKILLISVLELSQAALNNENNPLIEKDLIAIHTTSQKLLNLIVHSLSLEPVHWTKDFLASLHLDLRTPLSPIIGFPNIMLAGVDGPINDAQRGTLIQIKEKGEKLVGIISQVLDVERIEDYRRGMETLHFEEANLKELIEEFLASVQKTKSINVEASVPHDLPKVRIDFRVSTIIARIIVILWKNFRQGKVMLTASGNDDIITIKTKNVGLTLPTSIVEEFKHIVSGPTLYACRHFDEALDLSISHALIEIHGGKMWLNSSAEEGTEVTFTLPILR